MYGLTSPALYVAWRNRLARQRRFDSKDNTRCSHTTSDRSIRGAVASFAFFNSKDRKEVNSHV